MSLKEQSAYIRGPAPIFELVQILCALLPCRFVAADQPLLAVLPSDLNVYTGSPGDDFIMFREKQHRMKLTLCVAAV